MHSSFELATSYPIPAAVAMVLWLETVYMAMAKDVGVLLNELPHTAHKEMNLSMT